MDNGTLTKSQKKNKKKKEAAKKKKQNDQNNTYQVETDVAESKSGLKITTTAEISEENEPSDSFEEELCWCIHQLKLGLESQKATKADAERSQRLIRILKSEKTPKAKKRNVMHTTFGDYRKKMASELKNSTESAPVVNIVSEEKQKEGVFYRKATTKDLPTLFTSVEENSSASSSGFMFNFDPP